jgi:hypothetical protein
MKKLLITLTAIVSAIVSFAEHTQPVQKTFKQDPFNHPDFPAVVVTVFAGIVLLLLLSVGIYMMRVTRFLKSQVVVDPVITFQPKLVIKDPVRKKWSLYGSLGVIVIIVAILTLTVFIHI